MRPTGAAKRRSLLIALLGCATLTTTAHGDGVGNIMTSKSLPPATVAVIDPEGGGSSSGTTDVNVAAGDIIYFRLNTFAVPDGAVHGIGQYITEYLPGNTELVGVRILDENGLSRPPNPPGIAEDTDCSGGGCTIGSFQAGSIAQLYADTGVFYVPSTDPRASLMTRNPADQFITLSNGIQMNPEPARVNAIQGLLGLTNADPKFAHNEWDWDQVQGFGISTSITGGTGPTPHRYGSPVAGPDTWYGFEATANGSGVVLNDTVGPWQRIIYPGSTIGTGGGTSSRSGDLERMTLDASTLGTDVTPLSPLDAVAVRFATGEARIGKPLSVEVALRVLATPLDPVQMGDVDCAETVGGDTSAQSASVQGRDNPWGIFLPSPSCVFLKLKFDLEVDKDLAINGETLTYTLSGKNLSLNDDTGVVVRQQFDPTNQQYVVGSASGGGALEMDCAPNRDCIRWDIGDLPSGAEYMFTSQFIISGGGGAVTNVQTGVYSSTDIPSFETTAVTLTSPFGVDDATLTTQWDPTLTYAQWGSNTLASGASTRLTGTVSNTGTDPLSVTELSFDLPTGWSAGTLSYNCGSPATASCGGTCGSGRPTYNFSPTIATGASCTIAVTLTLPAQGANPATGLFPIGLYLEANEQGTYETYYRDITTVNVGTTRTQTPVLDCPVLSTTASVTGATESGAGTSTVFFDGFDRGDGTMSGGNIDIPSSAWASTFGDIYGGLEVRATATASGELESEKSDACYVTQVPTCSNGLDDDGDGFVDFPADPGCSSATDRSEDSTACSDGLDNDGDGDVDYPDDPECSSPDDTSEGGAPQCNDGIDNDGDGQTDFGSDSDCTSATDRTESNLGACNDRSDNDSDTFVDFPDDPGCDSIVDDEEIDPSPTPGDTRARLLVVFDSSGSMNWNTCADDFTDGDGSDECAGSDVSCATCSASGCGDGIANDSRLAKAKAGLSSVVAAFGEVEFGLMRFHQRAMSFSCPGSNASNQSGGWQGAGAVPCGGGFDAADLLVGFSQENQADLLAWMDGDAGPDGEDTLPGQDIEIRGSGTTPLAGSLASAETYLDNVAMSDSAAACRPYRVILVTDGVETCGGNPSAAAASLLAAGYQVNVIGFAVSDAGARASLDSIASSGGTGSAIFVSDESTLAAAISDIVDDTLLVEVCDNGDNDCDTFIDEGFTKYCDRPNGVTTLTECADPGETVCDGQDDNCNGFVDEGLLNACGECGPTPTEVCNGIDDDCDGVIDPPGTCSCPAPQPEFCDNMDNDCDGLTDEGLTRVCGTDVGVCTSGVETCSAGMFGGCTATGGSAETCDNLDNDCDGAVDEGVTMACGTSTGVCEPGVYLCVGGSFDTSTCVGAVTPGSELCNTLDDDCDGSTDEGTDPGTACGSSTGICTPGTLACVGGSLVCTGGTGGVAETCNATDDDCDGNVDEEVPTGGACGNDVGECRPGVLTCNPSTGAFECIGETGGRGEICDGIDNDCDMNIDEGDPGGGTTCGSSEGICTPGVTACVGGMIECTGGTSPETETCDLEDDDCDGLVDEGNPDGGADCGTTDVGTCELGSEVCQAGTLVCVGDRGPGTEICDGLDNDCDTMIDEGNPEGGDLCGDDTGACMSGTTLCTGGMLVCDGAVGPAPEVCDGIDNDCDGVIDDGLDVGAPCGSSIGECQPGIQICEDGAIICDGAIGPEAETCDALDNDCDMAVDEELPAGGVCGATEGVCMPGMIQCVDGAEICVGEMPAGPEVCDCEDNDCDMMTDEGSLCGDAGGQCVDCQCALPCSTGEFGRCPTGRTEVDIDGMCFCVAPRCTEETCGMETLEVGGETVCAPDEDGVPTCTCKSNECTFPCDGVVCSDGSVCNPDSGRCVVDDCRGFGCPDGEICEISSLSCVPDPCGDDVMCAADEACRDGVCEPSCADVDCDSGEICRRGVCVDDLCDGVTCTSDQRCDEATGDCVDDLCTGVMCLSPSVCDPEDGGCGEDPCLRVRCPGDERCFEGECIPPVTTPDGGMMDVDGGTSGDVDLGPGDEDPEERVLATGGGGCTCRVEPGGPPGWPASFLLAFVTLGLIRRRRNR